MGEQKSNSYAGGFLVMAVIAGLICFSCKGGDTRPSEGTPPVRTQAAQEPNVDPSYAPSYSTTGEPSGDGDKPPMPSKVKDYLVDLQFVIKYASSVEADIHDLLQSAEDKPTLLYDDDWKGKIDHLPDEAYHGLEMANGLAPPEECKNINDHIVAAAKHTLTATLDIQMGLDRMDPSLSAKAKGEEDASNREDQMMLDGINEIRERYQR